MFLSRRGSTYYLWFVDAGGKRRKVSCRTTLKSEATKFLVAFKRDAWERQTKVRHISLSGFKSEFLAYSRGTHRPKSTASYSTALGEFIKFRGDADLREVNARDVERFLADKRSSASAVTARTYHAHLKAAFAVARRWGYVNENVVGSVLKVAVPERPPVFLSPEEFKRVLAVARDPHFRDLLVVAVGTGLRLGELLSLTHESVDLERRLITVGGRKFATKSGRVRVVPMSTEVYGVFLRRPNMGPIFQLGTGERVSKEFKRLVRRAGVNPEAHFHSLRHSCATWLCQHGASLLEVQKILGHAQPSTTMIYSHLAANNITTFETVASDSQITVALNIGSDALEGPRTVLVANPPPGGGIVGIDSGFTVSGIVYPAAYDLENTIVFPLYAKGSDYQGSDYRIVGLPGAAAVSISQFLSGTSNTDWVAYWDNGANVDYLISFDGTGTFNMAPGRAFWLLNRGPLVIDATVPTASLDSTRSVAIALHPGWNLITNPFTVPVAWSDVQAANASTALGGVYSFDGSFSVASILYPYEGCLYDNAGNSSALVIPFKEVRLQKQAGPILESWRIEVELTVGEYVERLVSFGVSPGAEAGRDDFDWRRPRGVDELPEAYFSHPEWGAEGGAFATDIRPVGRELEMWRMEVRSTPRREVKLSFTGIASVPGGYSLVLIDDDRGRFIDLRTEPEYKFSPLTPVSRFRIGVGGEEAVRGLLEDAMPKEFALGNNFPNPFNPSTVIPVTVPWRSTVSLRIYSIIGELVRTLHDGPLPAGRHSFEWSGTSEEGRAVSAGIYFVQFSSEGGERRVGKMLLLK